MAASTLRAQHPAGGRLAPRADSPQRVWAKANLRGLMNLFLPTFREDGRTLDEDAIRHDVRHAIAQGFSGTLPMINWTLPGDPRWAEFHRILIDEAGDDLPVHGIIASGKVESDLRLLGALEELGTQLVLLASTFPADSSADQLHDLMAQRITATQLPVMLYAATGRRAFPALGPAGQPLDVYDRIADLDNVVAVKISQPVSLTSAAGRPSFDGAGQSRFPATARASLRHQLERAMECRSSADPCAANRQPLARRLCRR